MKPVPVRTYVLAWAALMGLLLVTLGSAYVPLGPFNSALNLGIAAVKALLVAWFFMHLRDASAVARLVAVVALVMLGLLAGLSGSDYATRHMSPAPWSAPGER
jgi:cytochrome c oxidase subunit IV